MVRAHYITAFVLFLFISTQVQGQFQVVFEVPNGNAALSLESSGGNIFVGTGGSGIFRSDDNGNTWFSVNNGITPWYYHSLLANNDTLYAGSFGQIHRTTNNGNSWTDMNLNLDLNDNVNIMVQSGNSLYAGTQNRGVYKMDIESGIWTTENTGFHSNPTIYDLLQAGGLFLAATDSGVYLYSSSENNWNFLSNGLPTNLQINTISMAGSTLFAGTTTGLYRSNDFGLNWIQDAGIPADTYITNFLYNNGNIYVGAYLNNYYSNDLGENWTVLDENVTGSIQSQLIFEDFNFIGSYGHIYRKSNSSLSITENESKEHLRVSPNPTSQLLSINTNLHVQKLEIIDAHGRIVKQIINPAQTIYVEELSEGLFIVRIFSEDKVQTTKFVKY